MIQFKLIYIYFECIFVVITFILILVVIVSIFAILQIQIEIINETLFSHHEMLNAIFVYSYEPTYTLDRIATNNFHR